VSTVGAAGLLLAGYAIILMLRRRRALSDQSET